MRPATGGSDAREPSAGRPRLTATRPRHDGRRSRRSRLDADHHDHSSRPRTRTGWLAIGLATGILVAAIASPAFAPRPILGVGSGDTTPEHTISVTGTGRVVISPDVADLRIGVSADRADGQGRA